MTLLELTDRITKIVRASGDDGPVCVGVDCWSRRRHDGTERVETEYEVWVGSSLWMDSASSPEGVLELVKSEYGEKQCCDIRLAEVNEGL